MSQSDFVQLIVPNQQAYLPMALSFVRETGSHFGFAGSALCQLEMAVEEAVTNIMKHAFDVEENDSFTMVAQAVPNGMQMIIKEKGIPFDPQKAPQYQPGGGRVEAVESAGLGMFLMKAMVDECTFRNLGPAGKETVLVKYHDEASAQAGLDAAAPAAKVEPQVIQEKIAYEVRRMEDHEAIEICRCAYKSHGYSFFDEHIYFPERLVELNKTGQMVSAVAVTKENQFMGHACLLHQEPEDLVAELTFVFVNVEYRGQGAFTRLLEFLLKTPKIKPIEGLYAYAVANHPFTQKTMARAGIKDCGLLLATSPASWKFKGIPGDPNQRISVVMSFQYLVPPPRLRLYPPAHHRALVEKIYQHLGAAHDYAVPPAPVPAFGPTEISISENASEGCAEMLVMKGGVDPVREIRCRLRALCLKGMAAINLFLSLEDPATAHITGELEKHGFFFAGILPRSRVGEALILQYLNNVDLDYSKICAHTDMAKEILAYIQARDPNHNI